MPKSSSEVKRFLKSCYRLELSQACESNVCFSRRQFAFFHFIGGLLTLTVIGALIGIPMIITGGIRRLHDRNHSGWYLLLAFVPLVNLAMILYLLFAPGKAEGNRWLRAS